MKKKVMGFQSIKIIKHANMVVKQRGIS